MSFFNEYNESIGIVFQEPPPPSQFLGDSGAGETTPWKGTSVTELAKKFKEGKISEADFRAELDARAKNGEIGAKTIEDVIEANRPDPNAPKPSAIKPPTLQGGAGLQDYSNLAETDITNKVKKGEWTPEQGENALIASKGYSAGSAKETINAVRPAVLSPAQAASIRALEARGITAKASEDDIIKGAELKLWTPDEAYEALVALKGYSATEAATKLRLRGWQGGPGGGGQQAQPPARNAYELMSRFGVAGSPGELMARTQQPRQQTSGWAMPVAAPKAGGLSSVMGQKVQRPTVMSRG